MPQIYYHCTRLENVKSILKVGLVPNHANNGAGNYDDARWESLDGVYCTRESDIIESYIRAHDLEDGYAIVVLSVSPTAALPDEDVIEVILKHARVKVADEWGIDGYYLEEEGGLHEYFETRYDNGEEPHPGDLQDIDDFYAKVGEKFHEMVKANDPRPMDPEMITTLVDCFREFDEGSDGDAALVWKDIKDAITRRYPKMAHPTAGAGYSIRIPGPVGFSGRNRIVAIVGVIDHEGRLLYGKLPREAEEFLGPYAP